MNDETGPELSGNCMIVLLALFLSWGTLLLLALVRFLAGGIEGSRDARSIIFAIAIGSAFVLPYIAKKELARGARYRGKAKLSVLQSIFVTIFVVAFSVVAGSAFGVFSSLDG